MRISVHPLWGRRNRRVLLVVTAVMLMFAAAAQAAPGSPAKPRGSKFTPLAFAAASQARGDRLASAFPGARAVPEALEPQDGQTPSRIECRVSGDPAANINLDCDGIAPNNEPHIAIDPMDPNHMIASSNDYESCCDQFYTTFDGGETWITGDMSVEAPGRNKRTGSDPVTSFNRKYGTVIHASLNYLNEGQNCPIPGDVADGDVVASISEDGGRHWNTVVEVGDAGGPTACGSTGLFNDKEWLTTDNNPDSPHYGTSYMTWSAFLADADANVLESPIWEAHSTDGGFTWSEPQEISGSNASLCTFQTDGPAGECDEDQFSVATVGPDGTVYVSFINDQNEALWESGEVFDDQFLMVKSSDGGVTWSRPQFIVGLEDGSNDYPLSVDERQTLTNYQLRIGSATNIVADPTQNKRLYFVFFDNRNGRHDRNNPVTNTDVFITRSDDGGRSWSEPTQVNPSDSGAGNDQWFPWVDVSPVDGTVGVLYHDRPYSGERNLYHTVLSESPAGGTDFSQTRISTAPSRPNNSVFFQAGVPGCQKCARFHGDYIGLVYGSDGSANMVWTDMRDLYEPTGEYLQFIYFARR
jgi:hypothetical protein